MSARKDRNGRRNGCGADRRPKDMHGGGSHPDLAPLTTTQVDRLVRLAENAVAERGLPMRYDGAGALVAVGSDGVPVDDGPSAGLMNLARTVADLPRQQWRSAVAAHFDQMVGTNGPPTLPEDLESELYLRLVRASSIQPDWAERVPEFVPGVITAPATYAGRAVAMHFDIDGLGVSWEEASRLGLANLRRLTDDVEYLRNDGAELAVLTGTMFTASRALVLDTVLRESLHVENPPSGCLVAMPARDMLLVHVLRDQTAVAALNMLVRLGTCLFADQPGPVSPHVYHVADNRWHQLTDYSTGAVDIRTTGEFSATLDSLGIDPDAVRRLFT